MANNRIQVRVRVLTIISVSLLFILWIRLYELQIKRGAEYRQKSQANSIRVVEEVPGRGIICDRNGKVLVENRPSYTINLIPYEAQRSPDMLGELALVLGKPADELAKSISQKGLQVYQPLKLARDVDLKTLAAIKARALDLPGVSYQFEPKRFYAYPVAPHTIGYIGEISEREKKLFPHKKTGDIVGKRGIERKYEDLLAGKKGYRYLIVNALGQITGELSEEYIPPRSSGKLYLTLDLDLQLLAEELLADRRGAIVALDPRNGEILAIASAPKYDPEIFTGILRADEWRRLQNNPDDPLVNRAIQSGYPPASTFKMITLAAGIEEGIVGPDYRSYCSGTFRLGRIYHCFKKDGHGELTPREAIEQSCDVFFYRLGYLLGVEKLSHYMRVFGFGAQTGIDIENEAAGIVPDVAYLDRRYGAGKWSRGLALNIAIGQGESLVTPLQLACYCSIIATGGISTTPHLFLEMHRKNGEVITYHLKDRRVPLKKSTLDILRDGMRLVIEGERGTARWLKDPRWHLAGKTGTAQNPHGEDHSLFIGFGPFEDPVIAVAVVVENAGFGSAVAAPIGVKLMTHYLEEKRIPEVTAAGETGFQSAENGDEAL